MKTNRPYLENAGFTLIELMVTLAIGTILMTTAVPSMSTMIRNNNLATQTNSLVTDINLARSEAIKRGVIVILCRSADPNAANPSCSGSAYTWTTGWLVFASGDGDNTYTAGTDTLLRIGKPSSSSIAIKTNSTSNNNLEYKANGTTNEGGGTAIFALCDDRGEGYGRQIQVDPRGRPRLITGTTDDPIPNCASPAAA